ncbi:putative bifunctional diguanylate cyclase/phosphodiesterase [Thioalkalivibrio versutus]|uniref:putative bifunctional diguanylate cyclase/phosphodiesterase n=1 Tax=Thioalkalivibrio versutus TaxID=106634 RepID=UPI0003663DF9|nr:EAL domain-containing protein [Thioalkalivibrio versutus]OOC51260.1 PAS domain S-box protein [Thioalkalivibrio versutus]
MTYALEAMHSPAPIDLVNALSEAVLFVTADGHVRYANPAAERLFGTTACSLDGRDLAALITPRDPAFDLLERLRESTRADGWIPRRDPVELLCEDGQSRPALLDIGTCQHTHEHVQFVVLREQRPGHPADTPEQAEHLREAIDLLTRQVQERMRAEQALQDSHRRLVAAQRVARIGHWELVLETAELQLSSSASVLFGHDKQPRSMTREALVEATHPDDRAALGFALLRLANGETERFSIRHRLLLPNGEERYMLAEGERAEDLPARILGIHQDLTERAKTEQALFKLVNFDALTGLPNRTGLRSRLRATLSEAERQGESLAVLLLDIDRFTSINSTLGHDVGDALLNALAQRMQNLLRPRDTLARLAADEFAVILTEIENLAHAQERAQTILDHCSEPFALGKGLHVATSSVGISLFPQDARGKDDLLRHATSALHEAKGSGGNTCRFYTQELNTQAREQLELEQGLRGALRQQEFELHYQPQIGLNRGDPVGVEALIRWHHPERGMVSPGDFIPLAEKTGLIVPIGDWVLRTATRQLAEWDRLGLPPLRLAINLSARQFADPELPERILETLQAAGLAPERLEVEITESVLVEDIDAAAAMLQRLVHLGVSVAIDDFGTGQSSLRYLRRLPLTTLKIDREFTWGIGNDPDDEAITRAIIGLGKTLKLRVLAEGVETEQQHAFLRDMGCDEVQGFLLGRPMPAAQLEREWKEHSHTGVTALGVHHRGRGENRGRP